MSKFTMPILLLFAVLWCNPVHSQTTVTMTLEQMFERADQHSRTIQRQEAALREAEEHIREAKSKHLPEINISVAASFLGNGTLTDRNFGNGQSIEMPHFGNNFAVEAMQLIYGGGSVSNSVAMAKLKHEMATIQLEGSRTRVRFMLTAFYLDLLKLNNLLRVYDRNIELAHTLIETTRQRENQGVALQNDITRYELRLQNLELARQRIANSITIANANLVEALGLEQNVTICPNMQSLATDLKPCGEQYWQDMANSKSHDIRAAQIGVEMGNRGERLARAARRPQLSFIAANHFDGPITIEVPVINKNFNYWFVGLQLSWRLSSLYKANHSIRKASLATKVAEAALEESKERILLAVKSDYIGYMEALQEEEMYRKSLQLAQENYAVIDTRYKNDMAIVTDMVDAANELLNAELQVANSQITTLYKFYKLRSTAGNL